MSSEVTNGVTDDALMTRDRTESATSSCSCHKLQQVCSGLAPFDRAVADLSLSQCQTFTRGIHLTQCVRIAGRGIEGCLEFGEPALEFLRDSLVMFQVSPTLKPGPRRNAESHEQQDQRRHHGQETVERAADPQEQCGRCEQADSKHCVTRGDDLALDAKSILYDWRVSRRGRVTRHTMRSVRAQRPALRP